MIKNFKRGNMRVVETGKLFGNMNTAKAFYPESYTAEDRKREFLNRRIEVGNHFGFDGTKMFMADQNTKDGSYFELTRDYVDANPLGWTDINEDILVLDKNVPGVVIGHPVADCPVVMAYDTKKEVIAIGHCSADLINIKMPTFVVESLQKSHDSKINDILVYISSCAGKDYTYDKYPNWATNDKVWNSCINIEDDGLYHIDLKLAILKQLLDKKINSIDLSRYDTIKDKRFYSNSAAYHGDETKKGRNFAGAFIESNEKKL